jgi:hypothetical protein
MSVSVSPLSSPYPKDWAALFFSQEELILPATREPKKRWRKGLDGEKEPKAVYNGANKREKKKRAEYRVCAV